VLESILDRLGFFRSWLCLRLGKVTLGNRACFKRHRNLEVSMRFLFVMALGMALAACSSNNDGSGAATTAAAVVQQPSGPAIGSQGHLLQSTSSDRVLFGYDQFSLSPEAQAQVGRWAKWMQANAGAKILVEGHADERGTRDYNFALGARRSHAVKAALQGMGISGDRIETTTFGKERPAVEGSNDAAWAQNRRGVVVVTSAASS
jgi:peptidoglycan-associated lipoprotein